MARLFAIVQPDIAVFGPEGLPATTRYPAHVAGPEPADRIITGETVRDDDGLAKSSRNSYLSDEDRAVAPALYASLQSAGDALQSGQRDFEALEAIEVESLKEKGFDVDYFAIRRAQNLEIPDRDCDELVSTGRRASR